MRNRTNKAVSIQRRARKGMALFLIAFLNLTLQPCAMAAEILIAPDVNAVSEHCIEHGHQAPQQEHHSSDSCAQDANFLADARSVQGDNKKVDDLAKPFLLPAYDTLTRQSIEHRLVVAAHSPVAHPGSPSIPDLFCRYLK